MNFLTFMESDTVKTAVALRLISIISNSNQPESEVIFPFTAVGILSCFTVRTREEL